MARKSKRRANHEGTIFQRENGQWIVQLTVEKLDGSSKRVSRHAKSQEHGRMVLATLKEKHRHGETVDGRITVEELAKRWLSKRKGDESTLDSNQTVVARRIIPLIGTRKCDDLTVDIIEQWIDALKMSGYDRKKETFTAPLGLRSQQVAFDLLSAIFNYGMRRKLVRFNPCEPEVRPRPDDPEIRPFTEKECGEILSAVKGSRIESLYHLAFSVGPRQGELFGLQWHDVDWANSTIRIERQARDYAGHVTIKSPKTKGSRRTVSLADSVMAQLAERRKLAVKEGRARPEDFIFPSRDGFVIRRTNFGRRQWKSLLAKLKINHRGFHHVRHTAATAMLREGTPLYAVAHILGHSNSATTQKTYSHYIPSDGKIAAGKMQVVLNRMTS
ncbi:tyrosine-type recombinase/integrase [Planctomicrobium piriforme]|uniref:Site-specific recombinase XerD n=1 Tax=Planctomicrobium piriforme TaxID=1576369 RepID=A0A1I3EA84_9PLAN|nr:site-specific integrase [Planctomicrobium piriforme]SFH95902.1 Site-specific recombinase XerD [Planctomicrobium piriforme]